MTSYLIALLNDPTINSYVDAWMSILSCLGVMAFCVRNTHNMTVGECDWFYVNIS